MSNEPKRANQETLPPGMYRLSDGTLRELDLEAPPPDPQEVQQEQKEKKRYRRGVLVTLACFAALIGFLLLVRALWLEPVRVDGPSMEPTLVTEEYVLVEKYAYGSTGPARFDIVQCWYPEEDRNYIKRVVGLPGETLELRQGRLFIDGQEWTQPFVKSELAEDFGPLLVGEGQYFVLGDNRQNSRDSRDPTVGSIPSSEIIGRARSVVYPISHIRSLALPEAPLPISEDAEALP